MEEKEIKDFPMDPEKIQETLDKIYNIARSIARSIAKVISNTFSEFWDRIGGDVILQYKKLYEESQWKYIKKGKRYVKVRRHNSEDIGRAFSRKIQHYKKQVQRSLSSK